jgi:hypothetical protein
VTTVITFLAGVVLAAITFWIRGLVSRNSADLSAAAERISTSEANEKVNSEARLKELSRTVEQITSTHDADAALQLLRHYFPGPGPGATPSSQVQLPGIP